MQRTDRVKGVDLHPTEPWLLANLYNGNVYIWNYNDQTLVKSFEITELPVRAAKFVPRKQWVLCGADDMLVRVFNYNTMDKVKTFEAHGDYIRCISIHPTLPYVLTCSDDMLIKLWDWDKNWSCIQVFEGHSHYVMQVCFNPKDTNTFASSSLDRTIKVWSLGQPTPNFTLEGHEKGVNCVDYFTGGDRPYLISGADDRLVKVWDYQTKACVQTLEGHSHNVSAVCFHPELPIILTGSEDGTVKIWHSTTYRLENTLDYRMERVWSIGFQKGTNSIAVGYDEGVVMVKIGREEPVASMDASGKIIWAKHNEVQTVNVKALGADFELVDGERLPLAVKDMGSCDLYPQSMQHNPNGRFVTVCGDGEFIVYTALAWRNKSFGSGLEFVWSPDSSEYAIRESGSKIKIFKNFQEKQTLKVDFSAEGLYGGGLIGVRSNEFVCFYDWTDGRVVRRIDVAAKHVYWSDNGDLVAIVAESSFYVLKFNRDVVDNYLASGKPVDEDGIEDAFELQTEVSERVRTGVWVGDCFIYNNAAWRLNYYVGGEVTTMYHLDRPMYLLGYLASYNRVFLIDREFNVVSYTLLLSLIEFKTLVMRGDMDAAMEVLSTVPKEQLNNVARFLEAKGLVQEALDVATEPDYRFDLAFQLGNLEIAQEIAILLDSEPKWKQLGELAMTTGMLDVAEQCLKRAKDFSGLLLLYSAQGNRPGMEYLADLALNSGKHNVAFLAKFLLGQVQECVNVLLNTNRVPEAAFFARTYLPSQMCDVVQAWKKDLSTQNLKAAEALADPAEYPNLFPQLETAFKAELYAAELSKHVKAATQYVDYEGSTLVNLLEQVKEMSLEDAPEANGAPDCHASQPADNGHQFHDVEAEEEDMEEALEEDVAPAPVAPPPPVAYTPPVVSQPPPVVHHQVPATSKAAPPVAPMPAADPEVEEDLFGDDGNEFADADGDDGAGENIELDDDWGLEEEEGKKD